MKKVYYIIVVFIIILLGLLTIKYFNNYQGRVVSNENNPSTSQINSQKQEAVKISYSNFAQVMSRFELIKDVPKDYPILLKFFNFNSGSRQWEKSFIISQDGVTEGSLDNPEITIILNSKYLDGLTTANFCSAVQQARNNGDLGFETETSSVSLAWKYKALFKYKKCFGF